VTNTYAAQGETPGWIEGSALKPESNTGRHKEAFRMMYPTLDSLYEAVKTGETGLSFSLPTFGGPEPVDAPEIWSWDPDRYMVGTCAADLSLIPRSEWTGDVKIAR